MSTFIQTLRQDLISLRWYLPCWIASLALAIAQQGARPPEATTSAYAVTLALTLFVIGSGAGVFGSLLFGHTASDDRSAWHTRPLQRSAVGLEKLVMVALLLVLPLSVASAFAKLGASSLPDLWDRWQDQIAIFALFFMLLTYVGVACRRSGQLLIAFLILLPSGAYILKGGSWLNERYAWLTFNDTGATLAWAIFWIGSCALIIRQYAKPHLGRHVSGAALIVAAIALISVVLPNPRRSLPNITTAVHYASITSLAATPADQTTALARLFAAANANSTKWHFRPTTPWMMRAKFEGFDSAYVWQPRLIAKDLGVSVQRGGVHAESPYFPTETLLRAVGLGGYTMMPPASADSFDLPLDLAGPPDTPVTILPAAATYAFFVQRLTAEPLFTAPAHVGEHRVDAASLSLQRFSTDDGSAWGHVTVHVEPSDAFDARVHGPRAAQLALIASHEATRRAVIVPADNTIRRDPQTDAARQTFLLEPWDDVPWEELRLVVVKLKPDARVTTDRVSAPN